MASLVLFLVFCQALGALTGAFTAVWGELAYIRAIRDGRLDRAERVHLDHIARGLRYGMSLLLLSSFALVVVAYLQHAATQPALMANYWVLVVLAILVIAVSWALSHQHISFALGSTVTFTGWWFLAFLALGQIPQLSFGSAVAFFAIATAIFYVFLQFARFLSLRR